MSADPDGKVIARRLRLFAAGLVAVLAAALIGASSGAASTRPYVVPHGLPQTALPRAPLGTSAVNQGTAAASDMSAAMAKLRSEVGIFSGPLAPTPNPILPRLHVLLGLHGGPLVYRLIATRLEPGTRRDYAFVHCAPCVGHGHFSRLKFHKNGYDALVKGTILMTGKTIVLGGFTRVGYVGRIQGYRLKTRKGHKPTKQREANGCLGADTAADPLNFKGPLPLVPCVGGAPRDRGAGIAIPAELSSSEHLPAAIAGKTSGPRWLSIFQVHGACLDDPQLMVRKYGGRQVQVHVHGSFVDRFTTGTATRPGRFCAYLQTGSLYRKVPDGQQTLFGQIPFFAGDYVDILASTSVVAGQQIEETFQGSASARQQLWTFHSTQPCQADAQAEAPRAYGFYHAQVGPGNFAVHVLSLPINETTFVCAYLQTSSKVGSNPAETELVGNTSEITVTGAAAAKAQARRAGLPADLAHQRSSR